MGQDSQYELDGQEVSTDRLRAEAAAIVDVLGAWADDSPAKTATGEVTARVIQERVAVTAAFDGEEVILTTSWLDIIRSPEPRALDRHTAALVAAAWGREP